MSVHEELEEFLMSELARIGEYIEDEPKRALAVAETIAARGNEISEWLLQLYIIPVPSARCYVETAIAFVCGLGLLDILCTCSCPEEKVHCFREIIMNNPEYVDAPSKPKLAAFVKDSVEKLRVLMYDDCTEVA